MNYPLPLFSNTPVSPVTLLVISRVMCNTPCLCVIPRVMCVTVIVSVLWQVMPGGL